MSNKSNYISTNRSKHYLKCHLIFLCKYRKKLLVGQLKDDMRSFLLNITSNSDFQIEVFESDLDHIHFLIRYIPRVSITSIVRKLKQESTYTFRVHHTGHSYLNIPDHTTPPFHSKVVRNNHYLNIFGKNILSGLMVILLVQ